MELFELIVVCLYIYKPKICNPGILLNNAMNIITLLTYLHVFYYLPSREPVLYRIVRAKYKFNHCFTMVLFSADAFVPIT
jgi:hypothetical protein